MGSFSIWHWLVVLIVIGRPIGVFAWFNPRNRTRYSGSLKGFGGWLLWLAIGTWIAPFRNLASLSEVTQG
jgi:hypothetical protein